jgi:membrane-associated phospholipid phosphatase
MAVEAGQRRGWERGIGRLLLVLLANVVAFNVLFQLYKMVRRTFVQRGEALGFDHAAQVIRIEKALHASFELGLQRWGLRHEWLMTFVSYYYSAFMWLFYACCAIGVVFAPAAYPYLRRVFVCSMLIALPWYAIYPLAPPRFMTGEGFIDAKAAFGPTPVSERGLVAANQFAAMPSMHVGWSTIGAVILAVSLPRWRLGIILGALHVFLMATTVVITGNHWWLDLVGGWLVVAGAFVAARRLPQELPRPWRRRAASSADPTAPDPWSAPTGDGARPP